jgi:hypothetical protein
MQARSGIRRLAAALLICLATVSVEAQGRASSGRMRVRMTGPDTYEVPGVIRVEGSRVVGKPARTAEHFVQFRRRDDTQLLTIPWPRQRWTGSARAITDGLLEFVPDNEADHLFVPLDAVTKIEVSQLSRSHSAWLAAGLVDGLVTFVGIMAVVGGSVCGPGGHGKCLALTVGGMAAGMAAGVETASKGREKWRTVSVDQLRTLLAPVPSPSAPPPGPKGLPATPSH